MTTEAADTADTARERAERIVGVLLGDDDPARRYATVQALQSGRLREVQAITLRQLEIEHGSAAAAAEAVGISRQSAGELLAKAHAPASRVIADEPAYRYGRYLAIVHRIVDSMPDGSRRESAMRHWYSLEAKAPQTLALFPTLTEAALDWLRSLRHARPRVADTRAQELDEAGAAVAEWVQSRHHNQHLTTEEQFAVYVGLSAGRRVHQPT